MRDYILDNDNSYEMINYSKQDMQNAMQVYVDSIENHFNNLGIKTETLISTSESKYKDEKIKTDIKANIKLYL